MKKYEFTGEVRGYMGVSMKRIRRLSDGKIGGWIEKEENLSHDGECFVYDDGMVFGDAKVSENANVLRNGEVYGRAVLKGGAEVFGAASVCGNAVIDEFAWVSERAMIDGCGLVTGDSWVKGDAVISGDTVVDGDARIGGYVCLSGDFIIRGEVEMTKQPVIIQVPKMTIIFADNAVVFEDKCVTYDKFIDFIENYSKDGTKSEEKIKDIVKLTFNHINGDMV